MGFKIFLECVAGQKMAIFFVSDKGQLWFEKIF